MASVLLGVDPWYWGSIDPKYWSCAITHCTGHNLIFNFYFYTSWLWEWLFAVVAARRSVFFFEVMGCGSFSEGGIHISTSEVFSVALGASLFSCLI